MSSKKTTKVKSVTANGTYDHPQHGTFYKYEYVFDDNQVLAANHKSQSPFKQGDTVEYLVKGTNEYGSYGTVSKPQELPSTNINNSYKADPKKQTIIVAQSSMTKAIDILLSGVVAIEVNTVAEFVEKAEALTDLLMKKQIELTEKHYKSF